MRESRASFLEVVSARIDRPVIRRATVARATVALAAGLLALAPRAAAQETIWELVEWEEGPTTGKLGKHASVQVPEGYLFAGAKGTRELLEAMGNPTDGSELGVVTSAAEDSEWFLVFEFEDTGYVKDDDGDELDADDMLESIREGTKAANEEREKMGVAPLEVVGWDEKPHYDEQTHDLQWCLVGESEGERVMNHNTRLLGRRGVMSATLVCDPSELPAARAASRALLEGFSYAPGQTYADFKSGDKVAEMGLAALVVGGGAAAAVKLGLFKKLWKFIVLAVVGAGALFKRLFSGRQGASRPGPPPIPAR